MNDRPDLERNRAVDVPPAWDGHERRRAPRRTVLGPMLVPVDIGDDHLFSARPGEADFALLVDVSETGAGIQSMTALPPGSLTWLRWQFPNEAASFEACGEIAWSNAHKAMGVRFVGLAETVQAHLRDWLRREGLAPAMAEVPVWLQSSTGSASAPAFTPTPTFPPAAVAGAAASISEPLPGFSRAPRAPAKPRLWPFIFAHWRDIRLALLGVLLAVLMLVITALTNQAIDRQSSTPAPVAPAVATPAHEEQHSVRPVRKVKRTGPKRAPKTKPPAPPSFRVVEPGKVLVAPFSDSR